MCLSWSSGRSARFGFGVSGPHRAPHSVARGPVPAPRAPEKVHFCYDAVFLPCVLEKVHSCVGFVPASARVGIS
eukprot:15344208-Alexandrium_andersonii.AAC.1